MTEVEGATTSFKEWYKDNGDALNERRRERYKTDIEYKKTLIARDKLYRTRIKGEELKPKTRVFVVKGKSVEGVSLRDVANTLQVSCRYISKLISDGILPESTLGGKQRFYTRKQCRSMVLFIQKGKKDRLLFKDWEGQV